MNGLKNELIKGNSGYGHPRYAQSLSEFGVPRPLGNCSGWILQRRIPETAYWDAMGCYPLFACADWSKLGADLATLENKLVSFSAVFDPFGDFNEAFLHEHFPDRVLKFKEHFVTDLSKNPESFICAHHRRNARKARRTIEVQVIENPSAHLDEWLALYSNIIHRHQINDIRKFSRCAFTQQFKTPGLVAFRALHQETVTGMLLWFANRRIAYYHLGAFTPLGYELNASFALFSTAIEFFAGHGFQWLNLGAGAGASDHDSGLTRFKQGWATGTRTAYFCGRVLDRKAYERLSRQQLPTEYFPAYRCGEFCKKKPEST